MSSNRLRFVIYKDPSKKWRWRLKAKNGKIIADSAEGYTKRAHALRMIATLQAECAFSSCEICDG